MNNLYKLETHVVPQTKMNYSKDKGMTIQTQYKNSLNCIYTKMHVHSDLVTVSPLKLNGNLL